MSHPDWSGKESASYENTSPSAEPALKSAIAVEDIDCAVMLTDPLNPNIELIQGDLGWIASSELVSAGAPATIDIAGTAGTLEFNTDQTSAFAGTLLLQSGLRPGDGGIEVAWDYAGGITLRSG